MDDVRGDFLGPPHGTTPAAVIANKIIVGFPTRRLICLTLSGNDSVYFRYLSLRITGISIPAERIVCQFCIFFYKLQTILPT